MFDDNFPHFVSNHALHTRRVVLFVDVARSDIPLWLRLMNQAMLYYVAPLGAMRYLFPAINPLENQAAMLRSVGLTSDVSPWFARGQCLYVHIALALIFVACLQCVALCARRTARVIANSE